MITCENICRFSLTCNVQRDGDTLQSLVLILVGDADQRHVVVTKRRCECQFVDSIDQIAKSMRLHVISNNQNMCIYFEMFLTPNPL